MMTTRRIVSLATSLALAAQIFSALPARADTTQTVTLNPAADTYVWTGESGAQNYGGQESVSVSYGTGATRSRSLLRFDLSSIPANAAVTQAALGLTISFLSGSGTIDIRAYRLMSPWSETAVTWNTQPPASDTITSALVPQDPGTRSWDFTAAVQNWLSGTWENNGVILIGRESGSSSETYTRGFWSREGATPPTLSITYTVPADIRAPTITDIAISNLTGTGVTVTWTTDEAGTSKVEYGTTASYGSMVEDAALATAHSVTLASLTPATVYHFRVTSADASGNSSSSADQAFTTPAAGAPAAGRLMKTACPDGAAADHPCRAVYYQGSDGKRHAFPIQRIYNTWYADFSSVVIVSEAEMASFPLGANVRYRPGIRMVKFQTLPRVYAVAKGGVLRWIRNEAFAAALYGPDWNTKIDDLSDAFVADYTFGSDIASATDYIPTAETAATPTIDADQGR